MKHPSLKMSLSPRISPRSGKRPISLYELCFLSAALIYILLFSS